MPKFSEFTNQASPADTDVAVGLRSTTNSRFTLAAIKALFQSVANTAGKATQRDTDGSVDVGAVNLDTAASPTSQEGQIRWNSTDKCAEVVQDSGVVVQIGQEVTVRARNSTGSTLANGAPVYVNGATGNRPTIAKADADAFDKSSTLIGLVTDSAGIGNNSDGHICVFGLVRDLDTSAYSEGATLYLSDGTSGTLTATKPTATSSFIVRVGYVTRSHASQGVILVSPQYMGSTTGDAVVNSATPAAARTAIGLGNVDNTSDANKPVSTATQAALDGKATKGSDGRLLLTQKPSPYVTERAAFSTDTAASGGYAASDYWQYSGGLWQCVRTTSPAAWNPIESRRGYIIDEVAPNASANNCFFALRKIVSGYAANACIDVVRASDSTTQTIGFDSAGKLDTAALFAFLVGTTGKVSKWYDQSGNANHATQGTDSKRPQIGWHPITGEVTVRLNQVAWLALPSVTTSRQNFTVATIGRSQGAGGITWGLGGSGETFYISDQGSVYGYAALYPGAVRCVQPHSEALSLDGVTSTGSGYTSFSNDASYAGSALASATMTGGQIGATSFQTNPGNLAGNGDATAYLYFANALSSTKLDTLRKVVYLNYDIKPQVRDNVVVAGDSITLGLGAFTSGLPYAAQLAAKFQRPAVIHNQSYNGVRASQMTTKITTVLGNTYKSGAKNVCIIWLGTNDINAGDSAATAHTSLSTVCSAARTAGYKVLVVDALPRSSWSSGSDSVRLAFNALVSANWSTYADAYVAVGSDATMGGNAAASDNTLYGDGIHPTSLGYGYLVPQIAAAAATLIDA